MPESNKELTSKEKIMQTILVASLTAFVLIISQLFPSLPSGIEEVNCRDVNCTSTDQRGVYCKNVNCTFVREEKVACQNATCVFDKLKKFNFDEINLSEWSFLSRTFSELLLFSAVCSAFLYLIMGNQRWKEIFYISAICSFFLSLVLILYVIHSNFFGYIKHIILLLIGIFIFVLFWNRINNILRLIRRKMNLLLILILVVIAILIRLL